MATLQRQVSRGQVGCGLSPQGCSVLLSSSQTSSPLCLPSRPPGGSWRGGARQEGPSPPVLAVCAQGASLIGGPPCYEVGALVALLRGCGGRGPGCPEMRPVAPMCPLTSALAAGPFVSTRHHCALPFTSGLWAAAGSRASGASPTQGWDPGPSLVASSAAHINGPLSFFQDPRQPGSCRTHTGSKPHTHSETDAVEPLAPAGQWPGTGSQCLAAPGEGGRPEAARSGQGELQCPHCLQGFGDEQGEELLRHVADCCL